MHRFYVPPEQCHGAALTLNEGEAHHAIHVLRIKPGDTVLVLDGKGRELTCGVESVGRTEVRLRVMGDRMAAALPCEITLLQAIPKAKIIESIIQKATELGAARIVPLLSERVVTRLDAKEAALKGAKWQGVAVEAIKQCGAPWLPRVEVPMTPAQFLARREAFELPLVAAREGKSQHPRHWFRAFGDRMGRAPSSACVWVGPEGDFTPAEIEAITKEGVLPINLGPLVLRCETAAAYCLSIISYETRPEEGTD